jgi:putative flippase GtrA
MIIERTSPVSNSARQQAWNISPLAFSGNSEAQFAGIDALKAIDMRSSHEVDRLQQRFSRDEPRESRLVRAIRKAWEHRVRLVLFSVNGMNVFAIGLLIQVILVRYAGMGHVSSYISQTIASVQISFLLSRFITWRDRDVAILRALIRFNLQQLTVTGLGMAGYAALEKAGVNYITANVVVTAALTPVSFVSSHRWSLMARRRQAGFSDSLPPVGTRGDLIRRRHAAPARSAPSARPGSPEPLSGRSLWRVRLRHWSLLLCGVFLGLLAVGLALGAHMTYTASGRVELALGWPGIQYLVYAVWLVPLLELAMLTLGQLFYRFRFRTAPAGKFKHLIIQITTTGREERRVNEVIGQIRSYRLAMSHEIWVVTEPGQGDRYPLADRVLTVPAEFTVRSERKARALEYSRRVRVAFGLDRANIKILFNDDDVLPTKAYIVKAFTADYDICEGITVPRSEYAVWPLGHFLASHADDMRTHACLVYCSVFQGILGHPLHVHGEGLTVTGKAESRVTWDWPAFASEDLVFGQKAARAGLRWGWFHEYVELTSPWTLRDFITQRRRWIWGDIHGVLHRDVFSLGGSVMVVAKYLFGLVTMVFSLTGLYLKLTGQMPADSPVYSLSKLAILSWLALFFACGWIGASSRVSGRHDDSRLLAAAVAMVMIPITSLLTLAGIFIPLVQGNPRTFQVISKTRQKISYGRSSKRAEKDTVPALARAAISNLYIEDFSRTSPPIISERSRGYRHHQRNARAIRRSARRPDEQERVPFEGTGRPPCSRNSSDAGFPVDSCLARLHGVWRRSSVHLLGASIDS